MNQEFSQLATDEGIRESFSEWIEVLCGVLQESVLGLVFTLCQQIATVDQEQYEDICR